MQLAALVLEEKLCSGLKSSGDKALIAECSTLQLKLNFSTQCMDISNWWSSSASVCLLKYTAFVLIKLRLEVFAHSTGDLPCSGRGTKSRSHQMSHIRTNQPDEGKNALSSIWPSSSLVRGHYNPFSLSLEWEYTQPPRVLTTVPQNVEVSNLYNLNQELKAAMTILLKTALFIPKIVQWSHWNVTRTSSLNA